MKKVISFILTTVLLLTIMVSAAFAADTTVSVSSVEATYGETVTVDVSISGNTGFDTYQLALEYDPAAIELVEVRSSDTLSENGTLISNENTVGFMTTTLIEEDGILFKADFKVLDTAPAGDTSITVNIENIFNTYTLEYLDVACAAGSIKIGGTPCPHNETTVKNAKEATCSTEGYTGDTVCSLCGKELEKGSVIAVSDHIWNWISDKAPTDTEPGIKHEECLYCGEKRNENTVVGGPNEDESTGLEARETIISATLVVLAALIFICLIVVIIKSITKRKKSK